MSNEEFENYLALVSRLLRLSPGQRDQIGEELRDHLETRTAELVESGAERTAAVKQAIEEFGDAAVFAESFKNVSVQNRKRWMMRFATVSTAVACLVVVYAMAMWPDGARFGTPSYSTALDDAAKPGFIEKMAAPSSQLSPMTQANEAIRQALKQPCVLDYDEEAFYDVMADLQSKLEVNIVLTQSAKDDSLDEDEPITVNLRGIPYSDALKIMLVDRNATYCVQDGVLKVISIDDAETDPKFFVRKMVNVSNLLNFIKEKESARIGKPVGGGGAGFGGGFGGGSGGGGGVFCQGNGGLGSKSKQPEPNDTRSDIAKLTEAIMSLKKPVAFTPARIATAESILIDVAKSAVESETWLDIGSGLSQMKIVGGIMVLVSTEQINDEVESFLIDLEFAMQTDRAAAPPAKAIQEPVAKPDAESSSNQRPNNAQVVDNPFGGPNDEENPFGNPKNEVADFDPFAG